MNSIENIGAFETAFAATETAMAAIRTASDARDDASFALPANHYLRLQITDEETLCRGFQHRFPPDERSLGRIAFGSSLVFTEFLPSSTFDLSAFRNDAHFVPVEYAPGTRKVFRDQQASSYITIGAGLVAARDRLTVVTKAEALEEAAGAPASIFDPASLQRSR